MEARKITIVSTLNNKKYVINSAATTLGELKRDLDAANIAYTNMSFMEGLTRTEMRDNTSVLPTDVPYTNRTTGVTTRTNELVFMLTNENKKIASGRNRDDIFADIKSMGLQDEVKHLLGKNYTQCSSNDLESIINRALSTYAAATTEDDNCNAVVKAILYIAEKTLAANEVAEVNAILCNGETNASPYTDEEIDELFGSFK